MRRILVLAVPALAAALGAASAAAPLSACGESGWPRTAEGAPKALTPGSYIWHDSRGWHVRAVGASEVSALSGRITADSGVQLLTPSGTVRVKGKVISFRLTGPGAPKKIDFKASCAKSLSFDFGAPVSSKPFLGTSGRAPATIFRVSRPATTGIEGQILQGPNCPVGGIDCGQPPTRPVRGQVRIETASASRDSGGAGQLVAVVSTDEQGRFSASLAPGHYLVTAVKNEPGFPYAKPALVEVQAGVVSHVDVILDTGIR